MSELSPELNEDVLRENQAKKIVDFLTRIRARELVQNIFSSKELPPFEYFLDFVVRINGIVRDIKISDRKIDGQNVGLSGMGYVTVLHPEDKVEVLKKAYGVIGLIDKKDVSYMIPLVINAVHLFGDGNGRTSRLFHVLLRDFNTEEDFKKYLEVAVGADGRDETVDSDPGIVEDSIRKIIAQNHGIQFKDSERFFPILPNGIINPGVFINEGFDPDEPEFLKIIARTDFIYGFISAYEYLNEKGLLLKCLKEEKTREGSGLYISSLLMKDNLSGIDWKEILRRYYVLKKEHVETIINSFVNPDQYLAWDNKTTVRDYFIKKVEDRVSG